MIAAATKARFVLAGAGLNLADGQWARGPQSSLDPAGPQSARIYSLLMDYMWTAVVVYALVVVFVALAVVVKGAAPLGAGPSLLSRPRAVNAFDLTLSGSRRLRPASRFFSCSPTIMPPAGPSEPSRPRMR
jgi:hypothetical protein